jgi:hypothetical protein
MDLAGEIGRRVRILCARPEFIAALYAARSQRMAAAPHRTPCAAADKRRAENAAGHAGDDRRGIALNVRRRLIL